MKLISYQHTSPDRYSTVIGNRAADVCNAFARRVRGTANVIAVKTARSNP